MSGDPEQEYFSDGITEDIITALSKLRWFFVIARNSSFIYKGIAVHMKQVAEELGVGYVVEGSVRKSGDRVRITEQLNDAAAGSHIWCWPLCFGRLRAVIGERDNRCIDGCGP
jgi:TolB-like protein